MAERIVFPPVELAMEERADGTLVLANALSLPPVEGSIPDRLRLWAERQPEATFLSSGIGEGRRQISYGEAARAMDDMGVRLLSQPVSAERPIMIVGGNSISHAMAMLAATSVGIAVAVVSPAYCGEAARPWAKIARILGQVTPGLILADRPDDIREILDATGSEPIPVRPLADLSWLEAETPVGLEEHAAARRAVGPDTVAKLLFTSGSTGSPKAVVNTQRMMVSNMLGLQLIWPFLAQRPPRLVDWLPWNHTFGGNCNFNIALFFGGSLHIDDGKPTPALVRRTVEALRENPPSVYFNVPGGYEALLPHLQDDVALASRFFGGLDFLFNAAAPMPATLRERIETVAAEAIGRVPPIVGGWGATETAPFSTAVYFDNRHASNLGVPLPGTEIKLVPSGGRYELRVRGPNVMPEYWRDPPASAAAFDEEGFYRIGDAGRLVDPERPSLGILFDGRTAENFKLSSGTWVNVGALRVALVSALQPLVSDVVVTGEGRDELGALLFMNVDACRRLLAGTERSSIDDNEPSHPVIREALASALRAYNEGQTGSSLRITRFHVLKEGPSPLHDEITEKGYINQRAVLRRRIDVVERLHRRPCDI